MFCRLDEQASESFYLSVHSLIFVQVLGFPTVTSKWILLILFTRLRLRCNSLGRDLDFFGYLHPVSRQVSSDTFTEGKAGVYHIFVAQYSRRNCNTKSGELHFSGSSILEREAEEFPMTNSLSQLFDLRKRTLDRSGGGARTTLCLLSSLPLLNYFHSHWLNRVLSYHILCEPNQPQPSILLSTLRLCNSTNWDHFRDFLGPSSVWRLFEFWCPNIFIVVKTIVQRMSILFHDFPHPTNQNAPNGSTMHVVVFFVTDAACPLFPPATALHDERTDAHWSYADEKNPSSAAKRNLWSHLSLSTGHFCLLSGPSTEIPFLPVLPLHLRWLR